ncbi:MAG TPA: PAS domain-containing protein [Alphaproteobacteria bacterium]|nr:PAS domain-containing protein [Alphaproteobacteria bacterium]
MPVEIEEQTLNWIAANEDRRFAVLLDYWRGLAGRLGRLPKRSEFDPVDTPGVLPNLFLVDVVRDGTAEPRFRFRLLGGAITARESVRPGRFLDEFPAMRDSDRIMRHYHDALDLKVRVRAATLAWDHPTKDFITYHALLLPLSEDGHRVDTLLGLAIYEA